MNKLIKISFEHNASAHQSNQEAWDIGWMELATANWNQIEKELDMFDEEELEVQVLSWKDFVKDVSPLIKNRERDLI